MAKKPQVLAQQNADPIRSDSKTTYLIEPTAPPYVAVVKVGVRTEIDLTETEARSELLAGHIWPKGVERKAKTGEVSADQNND